MHGRSRSKKTTRAKTAKKQALKSIKRNVEKIYSDSVVNENLDERRLSYRIYPDLYKSNEAEVCKMNDIDEIIGVLKNKWLDQIHEEDVVTKISKEAGKLEVSAEVKKVADRKSITRSIEKNFNLKDDHYLKNMIDSLLKGATMFFEHINVNPDIWGSVIAARFFHVPIEKVFECEKSILLKYYLPTVYNNCLVIKIHELTKPGELDLIWGLVKKRQKECKRKNNYINSPRQCTRRQIDIILAEGLKKKLDIEHINQALTEAGIKKKFGKMKETTERVKEFQKQTRQILA